MHYPGGKGQCYQRLIGLMPSHDVYIETHVGGGAVLRHKRPARVNIGLDRDPRVIEMLAAHCDARLQAVDAVAFLRTYPFTGHELIYADPPYLRETRHCARRLYAYEYTREQHEELLDALLGAPCAVMISGYRSDLYTTRLGHWRTATFDVTTRSGRRATECVWMNFPVPTKLHDPRYVGEDYRARERIKRKTQRWVERVRNLEPVERHALLSALQEFGV